MDKLQYMFEVKEVSDTGEFEGLGSVFGNIDFGLDVVEKGAFKASLREMKKAGAMPGLFWQHDSAEPIGEWIEMKETDEGLWVKGQLWVEGNSLGRKGVPNANLAHNMMLSRGPKGLSIGYVADKFKFEKREFEIPRGPGKGEKTDMMVRLLQKVSLDEVSIVTFAMNKEAIITNVKSAPDFDKHNIRDLEGVLHGCGYTKNEAKHILSKGFSGIECEADPSQREAADESVSENDVAELKSLIENM